jgi:hypothetical protein
MKKRMLATQIGYSFCGNTRDGCILSVHPSLNGENKVGWQYECCVARTQTDAKCSEYRKGPGR